MELSSTTPPRFDRRTEELLRRFTLPGLILPHCTLQGPLRHLRKAAQLLEVLVAVICLQFVIGPHTARRRGAMRAVPFLGAWLPAFLLLLAAVPPEPSARPAQRLPPRRPRRHSRPARILFTPRVAGRAPAARVAPLSVFSAAPADAFPPCATRRF